MQGPSKSIYDYLRDWRLNAPEVEDWQKKLLLQLITEHPQEMGLQPETVRELSSMFFKNPSTNVDPLPQPDVRRGQNLPIGSLDSQAAPKYSSVNPDYLTELTDLMKSAKSMPKFNSRGEKEGYSMAPGGAWIDAIMALGNTTGIDSRGKGNPGEIQSGALNKLWGQQIGEQAAWYMNNAPGDKNPLTPMGDKKWQSWSPEQRQLAEAMLPGMHMEEEKAHVTRMQKEIQEEENPGGIWGSLTSIASKVIPAIVSAGMPSLGGLASGGFFSGPGGVGQKFDPGDWAKDNPLAAGNNLDWMSGGKNGFDQDALLKWLEEHPEFMQYFQGGF